MCVRAFTEGTLPTLKVTARRISDTRLCLPDLTIDSEAITVRFSVADVLEKHTTTVRHERKRHGKLHIVGTGALYLPLW